MLEVISESRYETFECYSHFFEKRDTPGSGYSFPCHKNGKWDEEMTPELRKMYLLVANNTEYIDRGIVDETYEYRIPMVCKCKCGEHLTMEGDSMGEVDCPACGRVYNIFGQELNGHIKPFSGMNEYGEYY